MKSQQDVDAVNRKFNHFHDGFIKQIRVISDNEFETDLPWEKQRQFASNEEELLETALGIMNTTTVELDIHHYNYDWPNQPRKRSIIVRAYSAHMSEHLLSFIGSIIFDITFTKDNAGISCVLTHHAEYDIPVRNGVYAGPVQSMENGITTTLFSSEQIEIEETEWAEQPPAGDVLKAAPEE